MTQTLRHFLMAILAVGAALTFSGTVLAQTTTADVFTFQNPDGSQAAGDVVGDARLRRDDHGIELRLNSTGLAPGSAYTIWWIIFNNPDACDKDGTPGCLDTDFATPEVEASVMNATGRIANAYGNATFRAFLPVGFMHTEPVSGNIRQAFGPGLLNARRAEIHVVVRCHGPAVDPMMLPMDAAPAVEQISTLLGHCVDPAADALGGCFDIQAAVFPLPTWPD